MSVRANTKLFKLTCTLFNSRRLVFNCLSIEDAIADSVAVIEGSKILQFVGHYDEDYDKICGMIWNLLKN